MTEPPPGPDLPFEVFARRVVDAVRTLLPGANATRRGRAILLRHGSEAVSIDGATWTIWREGPQRRVMMAIGERRDAFVAENAARTIASALS